MTDNARRLQNCVNAWPECETDTYDPRCCRFPKPCSCTVYDPDTIGESDLEPATSGRSSGAHAIPDPSGHICSRIKYVAEGEAVCFECGSLYIFSGVLDPESLDLYRWVVAGDGEGLRGE